jgi:SecD/SecF fusion protein
MNAFSSLLLAANEYRLINFQFPVLFEGDDGLNIPSQWLVALGIIAAAIAIGVFFANSMRLKDYGWKISLILVTLGLSLFLVLFGEYKLGVDLKGGSILVYEIDKKETASLHPEGRSDDWSMNSLVQVIRDRINPDGLKEIVVRPFGPAQIEVIVPETDQREVDRIKELITTGGALQFMVVASESRDTELIEVAQEQAARKRIEDRLKRDVTDSAGERRGYWATLGRETKHQQGGSLAPFRDLSTLAEGVIRDSRSGEIIELTPAQRGTFSQEGASSIFQAFLDQRKIRDVDVLLVYDAAYDLRGEDLRSATTGRDQSLRPCIFFTMKGEGISKMGTLTQENLRRKLAIVFDNVLLSAPVIQSRIDERGEITGQFTEAEVQFIVDILKSGSMPVVLYKAPISENQIGSILGQDTIEKGSWSVVFALGAVLAFLIVYYRFAGLVASFALTLNLLLTVGIMVLIRAPLTLPGLAGLVLTVAMSVDANVLISERMREELLKGATLRMAIRNGFDKALSAIIDGNLTTFLTALVLYVIGTDQIRGFGTTLMLGNITSMFTAIFVARVIFEVAERTRLIKTLTMTNLLPNPKVDWVRFFGPATIASLVLLVIGVVATGARGKGLFDTDLLGGTSVTFILKEATPEEIVRRKLDTAFSQLVDAKTKARIDHNVYELTMEGQPPGTVYKVDSSFDEVELLQEKVREALKLENGQDGLKTFQMEIGALTETESSTPPTLKPAARSPLELPAKTPETTPPAATDTKPAETPADKPEETPAEAPAEKPATPPADAEKKDGETPCQVAAEEQRADEKPAETPPAKPEGAEPSAAKAPAAETPPASATTPPAAETPVAPATTPAAPTTEAPAPAPAATTKAEVKFPGAPIGGLALRERIEASGKTVLNQDIDVEVTHPEWNGLDNIEYENWTVTLPVDKAQAEQVLKNAQQQLASDVIWQTSSKIGGQVSVDTRLKAITALVVSMLGIVAYLWFRFQKVAWGLATIAALAHDALMMLTAIAVSYWLAAPLGFLGIEEFKISLTVVAAFLTLLGYSANDTIVIFDRLREIRGKSPVITREMLNEAVNQTFTRNVILAGITLTTVLILYIFGGPGIHAFAFALLIGVISGCYTTLIIAAPLLLWLMGRTAPEVVGTSASREERAASPNGGAGVTAGTLSKPTRMS